MAEVDKQIGESIRRIRKDKRIGQMALARKSGVSQGGISAIELGKREAYPSTLERLADALGVPVARFFEVGPNKVPPPPRTRLSQSTPEAIETKLYGTPASEAQGPLKPVLSEPEARGVSDEARRELDALEGWLGAYAGAPEGERFKHRAAHERVKGLRKRARFYHEWLFNVWSLIYDPRDVPFKSARQFASEQDEASAMFLAAMHNEAERERTEQSGEAG